MWTLSDLEDKEVAPTTEATEEEHPHSIEEMEEEETIEEALEAIKPQITMHKTEGGLTITTLTTILNLKPRTNKQLYLTEEEAMVATIGGEEHTYLDKQDR
jgi:hypothetical protein